MTVTVRRFTTIDAPPEEVWPWLVDAERELAWRGPRITELEQLDDGPVVPGTRFRGSAEVLGSTDTWVNEVTEVEHARLLAWRTVVSTAPAWAPGRYELEPTDDGARTRMTIHIEYVPRTLVGRLVLPVFARVMPPRIIDGFLEQLRGCIEESDGTDARSGRDGVEAAGHDDAGTRIGDRGDG